MIKTYHKSYIKTKPKTKFFKFCLILIIVAILSLGLWLGISAAGALRKITADSGDKNFFGSLFSDESKNLKGRVEGRTNILLLGMGGKNHPGGMLTDTIMVMSIDWNTKKVALMSIPRDLWVKINNTTTWAKINSAYYYGEQSQKVTGGGGKAISDTVSRVFDIPIHYYVSIDFVGFEKIIDALGGVDVYVDKDLYDPLFPADNMVDYQTFYIKTGQHHLDGETALKYVRSRETTSDFDRSKRQEKVLVAVKNKVLSLSTLSNPKKITDIISIVGNNLRTSMSVGEIKSFWEVVKEIDSEHIINKVLDTAPGSPLTPIQDERGYIIVPKKGIDNFTDLQEIAKNIFSIQEPVSHWQIEVLNGTGLTGLAAQKSQILNLNGYEVYRTANASKKYTNSVVNNCAGSPAQQDAQKIADLLKIKTVSTGNSCGSIDIQVIIGQNSY